MSPILFLKIRSQKAFNFQIQFLIYIMTAKTFLQTENQLFLRQKLKTPKCVFFDNKELFWDEMNF